MGGLGTGPGAWASPAAQQSGGSSPFDASADGTGEGGGPAVQLVEQLSTELERAKVRYCHWKSNEAIERSLSADNDLDVLVHRDDTAAFLATVADLGFRPALPPGRKQVPGILDLFGLDVPSGRIVHLQAHFRLVVGDDMTKNYRLPIEAAYLEDLDRSGLLPLPRPEVEYLVFVVRMVLKHCPWDAQVSYRGRLTASERRELAYLEDRIDPDEVERLRASLLPGVSAGLLDRCRRALEPKAGPIVRALPARHLARALEGYGGRPRSADTTTKLVRRAADLVGARLPWVSSRKRLVEGGAVVAVIGGDGSGKSSAVDDLEGFLGRHLVTDRFHLGKPEPSLVTRSFRRLARRLVPDRLEATGLPVWEVERRERFPGYPYLLWHLLIARDRLRTHVAARRAAGRGGVAVCDRYPVAGLETMDCPRLATAPGVRTRLPARWLSRIEAGYYGRITPPDVQVVLRVDPAVAVARRPDQDESFVRRRAAEIAERAWVGPAVSVIDADQAHDAVLREVRAAVWSRL